ncbi:MAG: hypothetical protein M3408_06695 [Actinomycetota bacterium]|nr:hypothetical protein [Actinomycetota bacterium]
MYDRVSHPPGRGGSFPSAERARRAFARRAKIRLVWADAETAPHGDDDHAAQLKNPI